MTRQFGSMAGNLLPKSPFLRSVSVLVGGSAGSQALMVLAAPLLTRLFTPEDFGLLAVYSGLLILFTVVASLRYELALPLSEDDQVSANVVALCLIVVTGVSLITTVIVFFFREPIATLLGITAQSGYLWLFPVGLFLSGICQIFHLWSVRNKNFRTIAGANITQSLTTLAVQLIGYKIGVVILLFGQSAGLTTKGFVLSKPSLKSLDFHSISAAGILNAARNYRNFPIYSTWSGLFSNAGDQLPPLLFATLFSPGAAGLYALAQRVLGIPMTVIGNAIGNVFFANAADAYRENRLAPLVSGVHATLAHIAMPPALLLMLAGPDLFSLVFGQQWKESGHFAQLMAPWLYVVFITSPLSTLLHVMGMQRQTLIFQAVLLMTRIGAIIIGASLDSLSLTIALFSIGSALCWIWFLSWINNTSGNNLTALLKPTGQALFWAAVCALPLEIGLTVHTKSSILIFLLAILSTSIICGRYFLLFRREYQSA